MAFFLILSDFLHQTIDQIRKLCRIKADFLTDAIVCSASKLSIAYDVADWKFEESLHGRRDRNGKALNKYKSEFVFRVGYLH